MIKKNGFWSEMVDRWPSSVVARTEIAKFSGGAISEKYMANLDSRGEGPPVRLKTGRKVVYPIVPLAKWLEERSTLVSSKRTGGIDNE